MLVSSLLSFAFHYLLINRFLCTQSPHLLTWKTLFDKHRHEFSHRILSRPTNKIMAPTKTRPFLASDKAAPPQSFAHQSFQLQHSEVQPPPYAEMAEPNNPSTGVDTGNEIDTCGVACTSGAYSFGTCSCGTYSCGTCSFGCYPLRHPIVTFAIIFMILAALVLLVWLSKTL